MPKAERRSTPTHPHNELPTSRTRSRAHDFLPITVLEGRTEGETIRLKGETGAPTIPGVDVSQAQTFINKRRVLVVSYNSQEPPGTLGYTVVVRPGCSVG